MQKGLSPHKYDFLRLVANFEKNFEKIMRCSMSLSQLVVERIYQVEPIWVLIIFCEIFKCFYKLGGMLFHSIGVKRHFSIEGIAPEIFCATRLIYKERYVVI